MSGQKNGRSVPVFHDARGRNANDSLVPIWIEKNQPCLVFQILALFNGLCDDGLLYGFAFTVEAVDFIC